MPLDPNNFQNAIGSPAWWSKAPLDIGHGGPLDAVLRLLELDEISRDKAREMVISCFWEDGAIPKAPWGKVVYGENHATDALEGARIVSEAIPSTMTAGTVKTRRKRRVRDANGNLVERG